MVTPVWPNICQAVRILGGEVREVALVPDGRRFNLDLDELTAQIDEKTRVIFYCSPSNPTGWLIPDQQRRDLLGERPRPRARRAPGAVPLTEG